MSLTKHEPSNSIVLTGAQMSRTALIIDKEVTDEQLGQIGLALVGIEGARCWWIGDYGVCLTGRKGEHYTSGRAEALGIEASSFRQYVSVAKFFEPCTRMHESLSFAHYRAAHDGCDSDLAVAQSWLEQAQAGGWSVSQLRKQINLAKATQTNDNSEAEQNEFEFMDKADKWATTKRKALNSIEPETARNLLQVRWVGVVQFIDELREIAKG